MPPDTEPAAWPRFLRCTAFVLVLIKLWLVAGQTMMAIGDSPHDDRLFLKLAASLLQGEWLGPYTDRTLAKGPFYSIFIAATFLLGVPLFTAVHVLYATACGVLVRALKPLRLGTVITFALFVLLLFNPVTYDTRHHFQVLRQTIIPFLSLFIAAGIVGLAARRHEPARRQLPWTLLLGATLGFFWITREESVWILPAVTLPGLWIGWNTWRARSADNARARLAVLMLSLAVWIAIPLALSALNFRHYGIFTTCEFKRDEFKAAYGALTRVTPAHWHPHVPVARETRERIYAVSPAFARLQPLLEGKVGDNWAFNSAYLGIPLEEREISGGGFMWALRDAVQRSGLSPDGDAAMAYYSRLAAEVNTACDNGQLAAGPRRASMLPPLVPAYFPFIRASITQGLLNAVTLRGLTVKPRPSSGSAERRAFFADLTRERLTPAPEDAQWLIAQPIMDRIRIRLLGHILAAYRLLVPWAAGAAAVAWIIATLLTVRRRRIPLLVPFGIGIAGSALAVVLIAALVDATSFPAVHPGYLSGFYGFYLLFIGLGWPALRELLTPNPPVSNT
jgi:hypothetical protein